MFWLLVGGLLLLFLVLAERTWLSPEILLTGEDLVTVPGRPLKLRARVQIDVALFLDPPVRNAEVAFHLGDRFLGSVLSDRDGFALLDWTAPDVPGDLRLRVTARGVSEPLLVKVVAPGTCLVVCDLDHTLADVSPVAFVFRANEAVPPMEGAGGILKELAARHALVYLTARDHTFLPKTRRWLAMNGLPEAPVLIRRRRFWRLSPLQHKIERLGELAKDHRLLAGIGDLPTDMEAYRRHGMRGYLLCPSGNGKDSEGVVCIRSWSELPRDL